MSAPMNDGRCRHSHRLLPLAAILALVPGTALAHTGAPPAPHDLWRDWNADPLLEIGFVVAVWLYLRGVITLWHRAGRSRIIGYRHVAAYMGGILALFVALISPLDGLSEALLSAHMAQHMILLAVAPLLLVLGSPLLAILWALPLDWRRALGRCSRRRSLRGLWHGLTHPAVVWMLQAIVLWGWHTPPLFQAALRHESVHALEHASFFVSSLLLWWTALQPIGRRRLGYGAAMAAVFSTGLQGNILGALLTFSSTLWYPVYGNRAATWGLTPLGDQQLSGLIMWIPAMFIYLAATLALLASWLGAAAKAADREPATTLTAGGQLVGPASGQAHGAD